MKHALLTGLIFSATFHSSNSQDLVFAKQFGGNDTQSSLSVAADDSGNIFVSTVFYDEVDADPGTNVELLNAAGSADIALVKLTSLGDFIWVIHLAGTGFETIREISADRDGNILICGYFQNTIDFDPGLPVYNLTSSGGQDGFLAKYDGNGNFLWAYKIGSIGTEEFYGLDIDTAGNVYAIGYFQNTIDFDPGSGVTNLTAIGGNALFYWKLNENGTFQWAKQIAYVFANDLALDNDANMVITGGFYGTTDFNPGTGTFNLSAFGFGNDAFVQKLDKDGIFQWAVAMTGSSEEFGLSIAFEEPSQNILVGGRYQSTVDFDPGSGVFNLTATGYHDGFIESFAPDGSFVWAKGFGGLGYEEVTSLRSDALKNIYFSGAFEQTCDFDPSANSFNLTSKGYTDGYVAKWDSLGNFLSVFQIGGVLEDWPIKMAFDQEGSVLLSGYFSSTVDFDPGTDTLALTTFTGWDGFAAKYCTTYTLENFVSICEGESYYAGGAYQTEAGTYYDYFDPSIGCDSTVITYLSISQPIVDLGNDTAICENDFLILDAGNAGSDYLWSNGDTTQTSKFSSGTAYVTIVDAVGCTASDTIIIGSNPLPQVDLGNDVTICDGSSALLDAGNWVNQLWSTGQTSQIIAVDAADLYSVEVTDSNGCKGKDTIGVFIQPLPEITFLNYTDTIVCFSDLSLELPEVAPEGGEYSGNGVTATLFSPASAGLGDHIITYTYTDSLGCTSTDSFTITVTICSGIFSVQEDAFIFPNPSSQEVTVVLPGNSKILKVINSMGEVILDEFLNGEKEKTILLPQGFYIVQIETGSGIISRNVQITR